MQSVTVRGYERDTLVKEYVEVDDLHFVEVVNSLIEEGLDIEFLINPGEQK